MIKPLILFKILDHCIDVAFDGIINAANNSSIGLTVGKYYDIDVIIGTTTHHLFIYVTRHAEYLDNGINKNLYIIYYMLPGISSVGGMYHLYPNKNQITRINEITDIETTDYINERYIQYSSW